MPYIYSIPTRIYRDGIPPAAGEWKNKNLIGYDYQIVPQSVAEADEEGCYKLVSNDGEEVTEWMYIFSECRAEDTTKVGTGKPLKDALGVVLAAGDFVMISDTKTSQLEIAEVVSFTAQKVRIRNVGGWGSGSTKDSKSVVKVDKSLFF
jgi:hypothetical protein